MASPLADAVDRATEDEVTQLKRTVKRLTKEVTGLERDLSISTALSTKLTRAPRWTAPKRTPTGLVAAPVLLLSDWHFGEVVDSRVMDGFNAYDEDIAIARWERVIQETPEMLTRHLHGYKFPFMVAALLGDMLSGDIHDELQRTNEHTTPETIVRWVPRIAEGLRYLADNAGAERLLVPCVDGNHDRLDKRTPMKRRAESSWTWLIYNMLAMLLEDDDRIQFVISRSSDVRIPIYDEHHVFVHGDGARGGGGIGGIWPPIMRYTTKLRDAYSSQRKPVDHVNLGHFHQWVVGRGFLVNGSGKGYDEYARRMGFPPEPPQQALYAVSAQRGIILHTSVRCE